MCYFQHSMGVVVMGVLGFVHPCTILQCVTINNAYKDFHKSYTKICLFTYSHEYGHESITLYASENPAKT